MIRIVRDHKTLVNVLGRAGRTIAKSFHTVESVPSTSIPPKREPAVSTLEFCCLRGGRRESNNFAIVLAEQVGRLQSNCLNQDLPDLVIFRIFPILSIL